jgi:hypothetical protein
MDVYALGVSYMYNYILAFRFKSNFQKAQWLPKAFQ